MALFWTLAKINAITLGGGYVIVPVMASSYSKKGWMEEGEFYDIFARAQAFPGPLALSSALLTAKKLCGTKGAVAAFFGVLIPPFFALIVVSGLMAKFGSLPAIKRFLQGAGAVVPGIVAALLYKNAKQRRWNVLQGAETILLALALVFFPLWSLPLLLAGIGLFYLIERLCKSLK